MAGRAQEGHVAMKKSGKAKGEAKLYKRQICEVIIYSFQCNIFHYIY